MKLNTNLSNMEIQFKNFIKLESYMMGKIVEKYIIVSTPFSVQTLVGLLLPKSIGKMIDPLSDN